MVADPLVQVRGDVVPLPLQHLDVAARGALQELLHEEAEIRVWREGLLHCFNNSVVVLLDLGVGLELVVLRKSSQSVSPCSNFS